MTLRDETTRALHRIALDKQRKDRVPGLFAGVARGGRLAWHDGVGAARLSDDPGAPVVPPGPDDQFLIASNTKTFTATMVMALRDEGRVMLVSTHNLGSVPEFCDRVVLVKGTVLAYGPTETTFTRDNLERAFGGVLRHFTLGGDVLHDDDDPRRITILTDDERPLVRYGNHTRIREPGTDA